jgi:hypothetical protein
MMMLPFRILAAAFIVFTAALNGAAPGPAEDRPAACRVTQPPSPPFVPPVPYPAQPGGQSFYFGTAALWVTVWKSPWQGLPLWDSGYRQKVIWWSQGFDWKADPQPALKISGRRLDAPAPRLVVTGANGSYKDDMGSFIMSGVNFPTIGCWEITGKFGGRQLTFVVRVTQ